VVQVHWIGLLSSTSHKAHGTLHVYNSVSCEYF